MDLSKSSGSVDIIVPITSVGAELMVDLYRSAQTCSYRGRKKCADIAETFSPSRGVSVVSAVADEVLECPQKHVSIRLKSGGHVSRSILECRFYRSAQKVLGSCGFYVSVKLEKMFCWH